MRLFNYVGLGLLVFIRFSLPAEAKQDPQYRLLLTGKRLHRLKLDVGRQTDRWTSFEARVKGEPASSERGFELALYGALTGDSDSCHAAVTWGLEHPKSFRQTALIADWCADALSGEQKQKLLSEPLEEHPGRPFSSVRDWLFRRIVTDNLSRDEIRQRWSKLLPLLQADPRSCLDDAYALFEFLDVTDKNFRLDLRQDDARLFANLPYTFLLAQQPERLERPDWRTRAAGLMMVNVDPNLQGSAFVQGWAMEDPKTARQGEGVAYELLWANPYLPGLGYYNMDPWSYDAPSGLLLARKSWDADSCWLTIFRGHPNLVQCPAELLQTSTTFGKLTLSPMREECTEVKQSPSGSTILFGLPPGTTVTWQDRDDKYMGTADAGGLFLMSSTAGGRVCKAEKAAAGRRAAVERSTERDGRKREAN